MSGRRPIEVRKIADTPLLRRDCLAHFVLQHFNTAVIVSALTMHLAKYFRLPVARPWGSCRPEEAVRKDFAKDVLSIVAFISWRR